MNTDKYRIKEQYDSPSSELFVLAAEQSILSGNNEPIGGGDNPDNPWPEGGN